MDNLTIDDHMGQDIMGQNIIHCAVGEPPLGNSRLHDRDSVSAAVQGNGRRLERSPAVREQLA